MMFSLVLHIVSFQILIYSKFTIILHFIQLFIIYTIDTALLNDLSTSGIQNVLHTLASYFTFVLDLRKEFFRCDSRFPSSLLWKNLISVKCWIQYFLSKQDTTTQGVVWWRHRQWRKLIPECYLRSDSRAIHFLTIPHDHFSIHEKWNLWKKLWSWLRDGQLSTLAISTVSV
jgi:hypothetical protein